MSTMFMNYMRRRAGEAMSAMNGAEAHTAAAFDTDYATFAARFR